MKLNTKNFRLLLNSQRLNTIKIANLCINDSSWGKLLGKNFDSYLIFEKHIEDICPLGVKETKWTRKTYATYGYN